MRRIIVTVAVISYCGSYGKPTAVAKHLQFERMYTVHRQSSSSVTRQRLVSPASARNRAGTGYGFLLSCIGLLGLEQRMIQIKSKKKPPRVGRATLGCPGTPGATVNAA
jgi:hypothetical protein